MLTLYQTPSSRNGLSGEGSFHCSQNIAYLNAIIQEKVLLLQSNCIGFLDASEKV